MPKASTPACWHLQRQMDDPFRRTMLRRRQAIKRSSKLLRAHDDRQLEDIVFCSVDLEVEHVAGTHALAEIGAFTLYIICIAGTGSGATLKTSRPRDDPPGLLCA